MFKELDGSGSIDFRRFYSRRIRRILPALALVMTVVLPLSLLFIPVSAQEPTAYTGIGAALFNANNYLWIANEHGGYFEAGSLANSLLHTWSLSVEEQFYLVFPALLLLGWVVAKRRGLSIVLWATVAASFVFSIVFRYGAFESSGQGAQIAFYASPARAWEFAIGGLVALLAVHWSRLVQRASVAMTLVGGALLAYSCVRFDDTTTFPGLPVLVPVIGTAMLIIGGTTAHVPRPSRLLGTRGPSPPSATCRTDGTSGTGRSSSWPRPRRRAHGWPSRLRPSRASWWRCGCTGASRTRSAAPHRSATGGR